MPTSSPPHRQRPSDRGRVTPDQRIWIEHRDLIGEVIDQYLSTRPSPEMREAVEIIEGSLRVADHVSGLT